MASTMRASAIMKSLVLNGSRVCSKQSAILPISTSIVNSSLHNRTISSWQQKPIIYAPLGCRSISTVPKWELALDLVSKPEVTGAILPFAELNIFQKIVFPYTYSVMYYLDFLTGYMPWWLSIVATTATVRLVFFPIFLQQNIIGVKTHNLLPQTQRIQCKINEAMCSGNNYEIALSRTKLKLLYDENGLTLKKRILPILFQAPMFISVFFLLRKLSFHPVEALTTGGAFWFQNLTVPDPFFILPIMTCASMFILLEYGLEGGTSPSSNMTPTMRWLLRGVPVVVFAFVYNFPAAVLLFWTTNNFFTLSYAFLLKHHRIRKIFNIPERIQHEASTLPLSNQTFKNQIKTAMDQGRAKKTTLEVRRLDDIAFKKAGIGPLRKTYKECPPQKREEL